MKMMESVNSWKSLTMATLLTLTLALPTLHAMDPMVMQWSTIEVPNAPGLFSVISGDSSDGLAAYSGGEIWEWDGAAWSEMTSFTEFKAAEEFSPSAVFSAAGGQMHVGTSSNPYAHFNGTEWNVYTTGTGSNMRGAMAYVIENDTGHGEPGEVLNLFARDNGRIYRTVEGVNRHSPSDASKAVDEMNSMRAIHGNPSDNVIWAVGSTTDYPISVFRSEASGTFGSWEAVSGKISHLDDRLQLNSVYALDGNTAIVGAHEWGNNIGNIWYTDDAGDSWNSLDLHLFTGSGRHTVFDIYASSLDSIWVVSQNSVAVHWDGSSWTNLSSYYAGIAADDDLRSLHYLDGEIWIGGARADGTPVFHRAIPEPGSLLLLAGSAVLMLLRRRK